MRRFNSQTLILVGATLFVLYLAGVPLLMLLYGSIRSAPIGEPGATFTFQNYVKAYFDKEFYYLLLNSVYYGIGTCLVTFSIGTFLAWVSERTNTPFKKLFTVKPAQEETAFVPKGRRESILCIVRVYL